ncbi:MAG: biotin--[acetyl-CoA-carboxylase] ligase [Hyphomicrobiales bacterium]|nr:biotin--[acetyl-CoA-carboxylase] ligase [Hyphomicrobiales bacterium]MDE2017197.1 biotin--[acetyl-CoA-carboxylase] ligase [Hyphomicrobiales bacterium]
MRVRRHEVLDSTSDEAFRLAQAGERGPIWVVATEQAGGRGRRGRAWASPPGNLYATLLLTDPGPRARLHELGFVAGVALADALAEVAPGADVGLKWPNDGMIGPAKAAGILVEATEFGGGGGGGATACAIGIGVNVASHPSGLAYPATCLAAHARAPRVEATFGALATALDARLAQWRGGEGFSAIRDAWLGRARGLGRPIRVETAKGALEGAFAGLDATGRLLVADGDGESAVESGDVFIAADFVRARISEDVGT